MENKLRDLIDTGIFERIVLLLEDDQV